MDLKKIYNSSVLNMIVIKLRIIAYNTWVLNVTICQTVVGGGGSMSSVPTLGKGDIMERSKRWF